MHLTCFEEFKNSSEFQPEPKIKLVECILMRPWGNKALKLCDEAEKAIQEKRFVRSLNQAQKALRTSPFFSRAYSLIGSSYLFQNDLKNAFLNLHKALAIDRKYSTTKIVGITRHYSSEKNYELLQRTNLQSLKRCYTQSN